MRSWRIPSWNTLIYFSFHLDHYLPSRNLYIQSSGHHFFYCILGSSGWFLVNISEYVLFLFNDNVLNPLGIEWEHLLQSICLVEYSPSTSGSQLIVYTRKDPKGSIQNFLFFSNLWSLGLSLVCNSSCQTSLTSWSRTFLDLDKSNQALTRLIVPNNSASTLDPSCQILLLVSSYILQFDLPNLSREGHPHT